MPCQLFFQIAAWLAHCCKKNCRFCMSLENIATADDEDCAHFFVHMSDPRNLEWGKSLQLSTANS